MPAIVKRTVKKKIVKKKVKRDPFLDSRTNNKAETLIRDFKGRSRLLKHPSIKPDIEELIFVRDHLRKLNAKEANKTPRNRERVKLFESHMRRIFQDIAFKKARLVRQHVRTSEPKAKSA